MTTIKSIKDLPDWFSLEKYEPAKRFSVQDWYSALSMRFDLHSTVDSFLRFHPGAPPSDAFSRTFNRGESVWNRLKEKGALAHNEFEHATILATDSAIRSMTVYDCLSVAGKLNQTQDGQFANAFEKVKGPLIVWPPDDCLFQVAHDVIDGILGVPMAFVAVDLKGSDAAIEASFRAWLKQARGNRNGPSEFRERKFSSRDCLNWFNSGVLPYLDLSFWARLEGVDIPDALYGNAVIAADRSINVGEAIRKTTAPLAARILNGDLLNALGIDLGSFGKSDGELTFR